MFAKFRSMFRLLVIVTWLRSSVTPVSAAPTLLSCIYGWAECLGLQDSDGFEEAQELGCPTTVDGRYAARIEMLLLWWRGWYSNLLNVKLRQVQQVFLDAFSGGQDVMCFPFLTAAGQKLN